MDWFSWLSKTSLDASTVHEYALIFTCNRLEEDDIPYFNHDFLQSMGISIAKHRLEILKLARKCKHSKSIRPIIWLKIAMKSAKKFVSKHIQCRNESALIQTRAMSFSRRWMSATVKKREPLGGKQNRQMLLANGYSPTAAEPVLMLTYGSPSIASTPLMSSSGIFCHKKVEGDEEIRWENMFDDLKPT